VGRGRARWDSALHGYHYRSSDESSRVLVPSGTNEPVARVGTYSLFLPRGKDPASMLRATHSLDKRGMRRGAG
jgi:hypothetical protein